MTTAPRTPATPALEFIDANFRYPGHSTIALAGMNGTLLAGEGLALIGPNGAGKTTLLMGILGQLPHTGTARILGHEPGHAPKGSIGYVPQLADVDPTFPVTVFDVVAMGLLAERRPFSRLSRSHKQRIADALERVDLADRAGLRFGKLSGGQRQRVLVARAIAANPHLILLDEPFNGLDHPNRAALVDIIRDLKQEGVAVVASTHDVSLAQDTADKVAMLNGRQIAFGPLDTAFTPDSIAATYGGHGNDDLLTMRDNSHAH